MNSSTPSMPRIAPRLAKLAVQIRSLKPDPANLRKHSDRSIEAVMASLARFGQQKPIVVDRRGVVVAGNGTLEAAKRLGWNSIAAVSSDLSGVERTLYAIADNRTAELSEWDSDALSKLAGELEGADLDAIGFTADELAAIRTRGTAQEIVQDELPEPPAKASAKPGDLWLLGEHRLLCGSCTEGGDVRRVMNGRRAALFATDPPYLVDYDGTNHPQDFKGQKNKDWSETYGRTWDDADANSDLYDKFIAAAVAEAITEQAAWYCWHASRRQAMLEAAWEKAGAFVHCQIVWAKNRPVLTRTWYMQQHEPCLMGWIRSKKPAKAPGAKTGLSSVWEFDTIPNGEDRPDHPTPKPVELFAIPIEQHTRRGDVVYEPFSGSGTQIIAAEQLGRRCFAIEIEPAYVDVAVTRWQRLTGQAARLDGDGRTWDQVAAERAKACRPARSKPARNQDAPSSAPGSTATSTPRRRGRPGTPPKAPRTRAGTARTGAASDSAS